MISFINIISIFCYVCSSTCHCKQCRSFQEQIFSEPKNETKLVGKQNYKHKAMFFYIIEGMQVYEERYFHPHDFIPSLQISFSVYSKNNDYDLECLIDKEESGYSPIQIGSLDDFNRLLNEKCIYCKYKNNFLEKVVPILNIQDMFEYMEFFFLMEEPLFPVDFSNNQKYFREIMITNYEYIVKTYTLKCPIVICKTCFINKINAKDGVNILFKAFEKKQKNANMIQGSISNVVNVNNIKVISGKEFTAALSKNNKKNSNLKLLDEANLQITKRTSKSSNSNINKGEENIYQQLSKLDLVISGKFKFTLLKTDSKKLKSAVDSSLTLEYKDTEKDDTDKENQAHSDCIYSVESLTNEINDHCNSKLNLPLSDTALLSKKLSLFQENLDSINKYLNIKLNSINEEDTHNRRKIWVNNVNKICEELHKNSDVFQILMNLKSDYIVKIVKQTKYMLEMIYNNLIGNSKKNKNYCFETMILFRDNMLIVRKVNSIFEYMINKLKSKSVMKDTDVYTNNVDESSINSQKKFTDGSSECIEEMLK
jgi:hypothetical protein